MPQSRADVIKEAILRYADGGIAEAIDDHIGNPDHDSQMFQRTIEDLANHIDKAIRKANA